MQPTTKGDKIFANINNATVYRSTSVSDAFSFLGIEPKKPLFGTGEQIGIYNGYRQASRDIVWYGVSWTHKYRRISIGGTRVLPVIQYTEYSEVREGWVKATDIYAEALPVTDPASGGGKSGGTEDEEGEPKSDTEKAPLEAGASNGNAQTSKSLTTVLYVGLSAVISIFLFVIFSKPKNQQ